MAKLGFLLLPHFSHLGLAAAIEPLFVANWLAQRRLFDWVIVSADGAPVPASNGMILPVDGDLNSAADCTAIFVLASFQPDEPAPPKPVLPWLRRMARFGVEMVGIENGSLVLAEAGLLEGHEAAIHWDNLSGFRERFPTLDAANRRYSRSAGRITCAGAASILDLMVAWIGWQGETALAAEVADHLLIRPQAGVTAPPDALVARAEALMQAHLDEPLGCAVIAAELGLSLRQLERRFAAALGRSVHQHYRLLRMARAHQLLQQTTLSVTDIAFACGFPSPDYFARTYVKLFGRPPSRDRRQSTDAPVLRSR
jgi:AraC family carnitine catabolism transcriptional activator